MAMGHSTNSVKQIPIAVMAPIWSFARVSGGGVSTTAPVREDGEQSGHPAWSTLVSVLSIFEESSQTHREGLSSIKTRGLH